MSEWLAGRFKLLGVAVFILATILAPVLPPIAWLLVLLAIFLY